MRVKMVILSLLGIVTGFGGIVYAQQETASNNSLINVKNLPAASSTIAQNRNAPRQNRAVSAEMALAEHLKQRGAKMYGAYWCPYCTRQKELFGAEAFRQITYIECDPRGQNPQPDLCRRAGVNGFPTWEINGQKYPGMRTLEQLADISGYKGARNFRTQG
jgi:glutaredoxin